MKVSAFELTIDAQKLRQFSRISDFWILPEPQPSSSNCETTATSGSLKLGDNVVNTLGNKESALKVLWVACRNRLHHRLEIWRQNLSVIKTSPSAPYNQQTTILPLVFLIYGWEMIGFWEWKMELWTFGMYLIWMGVDSSRNLRPCPTPKPTSKTHAVHLKVPYKDYWDKR